MYIYMYIFIFKHPCTHIHVKVYIFTRYEIRKNNIIYVHIKFCINFKYSRLQLIIIIKYIHLF